MRVQDALQIRPGDRVKWREELLTVLCFPELKGKGEASYVRISADDPYGLTRILTHEDITVAHLSSRPILVKGVPYVPTRNKR